MSISPSSPPNGIQNAEKAKAKMRDGTVPLPNEPMSGASDAAQKAVKARRKRPDHHSVPLKPVVVSATKAPAERSSTTVAGCARRDISI
jgi:hypothetical protein